MLNPNRGMPNRVHSEAVAPANEYDITWMIGAIQRYRILILCLVLVFSSLAVAHVMTRAPSYKATAHLQLTNLRLNFSRDDAFFAETATDPSFLETQVQIMRSARVALNVIDALGLAERPLQREGKTSFDQWLNEIRAFFRPPDENQGLTSGLSDARLRALKALQNGFTAERIGLSNVVEVAFTADDPELSARIVNEYVRAYIAEQNAVRADAAQSGSSWLRERLREVGPKTRVIASALPPSEKSNARGLLIIAIAAVIGGGAGLALSLILAFADRRVRTPEQTVKASGAECFGILPQLRRSRNSAGGPSIANLPAGSPLGHVVEHPNSRFSNALRTAKVAGDECFGGAGVRTLAVVSTFSGEGRSTIAMNYAALVADMGIKVLLIDCDPTSPRGLTESLCGKKPHPGLRELIARDPKLAKSPPVVNLRSSLDFLPLADGKGSAATSLLWNAETERVLEDLKGRYDYIVLDLPPLTAVADVRGATRYVDAFLLAVQWGRVTTDEMEAALTAAGGVQDRLLGSLLNNVNLRQTRWIPSSRLAFFRAAVKSTGMGKA